MSYPSAIGSPFGIQVFVTTPAQYGIATDTSAVVYSQSLARGLWICNINGVQAVPTNFNTGDRLNNYRQQILYDNIVRDPTSIVGDSVYGIELSGFAIIQTDGVTPVVIQLYAKTTAGGTWGINEGNLTFTRLY